MFVGSGANLAVVGPPSAELGPMLVMSGTNLVDFGPYLAELGPVLVVVWAECREGGCPVR